MTNAGNTVRAVAIERLFSEGMDTHEIARMYGLKEYDVYNRLAFLRECRRAAPKTYVVSVRGFEPVKVTSENKSTAIYDAFKHFEKNGRNVAFLDFRRRARVTLVPGSRASK